MKKLSLKDDNIRGEKFNSLIDLCFENCNYFSFTFTNLLESTNVNGKEKQRYYEKPYNTEIVNKLDEFYIDEIVTTDWYRYSVFSENKFKIKIYEINNSSKKVLKKYFNNIFLEDNNGRCILEDICFFINKKLFIGTVSHELICDATIYSEDILNKLLKLADWEEYDYLGEEFTLNIN